MYISWLMDLCCVFLILIGIVINLELLKGRFLRKIFKSLSNGRTHLTKDHYLVAKWVWVSFNQFMVECWYILENILIVNFIYILIPAISSLSYERMCSLFNLAAFQSQVASIQSHDNDVALKLATKLLQSAASIFSYLKTSVMGALQQEPTPDMNPDTLAALSALMLAEAQEIFVIKVQSVSSYCLMKPNISANLIHLIFIPGHQWQNEGWNCCQTCFSMWGVLLWCFEIDAILAHCLGSRLGSESECKTRFLPRNLSVFSKSCLQYKEASGRGNSSTAGAYLYYI